MPAAVFTYPEAASVGLSEDECKASGIDYLVKKGFYRSNGKALASDEAEGMIKVMADNKGKILGCHIFGSHSADIVQEVTVAMNSGLTISELSNVIHIHPTLGEILLSAIN